MAKNLDVHFSKKTVEWATPQQLFDELNFLFGPFTLDPCATENNAKCDNYFTKEEDGLKQEWSGLVYCNPPYGRAISQWVKKAKEESERGVKVLALLPARVDTKWFHEFCSNAEIYFIKGRIKFGGSENSAPFPSMLVLWGYGGNRGWKSF